MRELLRAYAITTLCGWSVFPLLRRLLGRLPDRGYSLCRTFGLTVAAWWAWVLAAASGRPLTRGVVLLAVGSIAALSIAIAAALRTRPGASQRRSDGPGRFLGSGAAWVLAVEALFAGGLIVFFWIQGHNPAVDPDSERFMDYALLRGCLRSRGLPIADPWYAGRNLAYYHFGYALVAFLVRATGSDPSHFFVPAIALQHALLWAVAFGAGLALTRRAAGGFLAAFFVLGAGNGEWIGQWARAGGPATFDWFSSSRSIEGTITEFPWFSMLWGDLHPYVMALPMAACALTLALADAPPPGAGGAALSGDPEGRAIRLARAICLAFTCAALLATHPWDLPVVLGAAALVMLSRGGRDGAVRATGLVAAVLAASILFLPFLKGLAGSGRGVGRVAAPSRALEWIMAYLPFLLLALLWAPRALRPARRSEGEDIGFRDRDRRAPALVIAGLLTAAACEIVYVRDVFESTSLYRMNTVFKLYRLAWLLFGLAAPCYVLPLLTRQGGAGRGLRRAAGVAIVLAVALVYPIRGTAAWLRARSAEAERSAGTPAAAACAPGADAEALFRALYPGDAAAASFVASASAEGEAVVEETGDPYTWSSRIATFSGVPTVLGWGNHEAVWRQGWQGVLQRDADVHELYRDPAGARGCDLIRRYGVRWIVVGERERQRYGAAVEGVATVARAAFASGGTTVYDAAGLCPTGSPAVRTAP